MSKDRIVIKDLLLRDIIGINDWERKKKQDILINLTIFSDTRGAAKSEEIDQALNYRTLTKAIIDYVDGSDHLLVEALAAAIARIIVMDFGAEGTIVRIEKPGALRFAASVGVEIERWRKDFE